MLCAYRLHAAWCVLRCETSVSPGFPADFWRAHMDRVVCCMFDVAALRMIHVACRHERASVVRDMICLAVRVRCWGLHLAYVPYVSCHVLLVFCCRVEHRYVAVVCRGRIWCRSHRRAMWTSTGSSTNGCSRRRRLSSNAAPRSATPAVARRLLQNDIPSSSITFKRTDSGMRY